MAQGPFAVGVDIGGTHLRLGLVDAAGGLHGPEMVSSRTLGQDAPAALLALLRGYITRCGEDVAAVGIGLPSTLDRARTTVVDTPNLPGLSGVALKAPFEAALGVPVVLEKDACMLAISDLHQHGLGPEGLVVGLYFGTGIGCALLQNGLPMAGQNGAAGEIGHIPLPGRDAPCGCGLRGCLEEYAGGKGLERIRRTYWPGTPIGELFLSHAKEPPLAEYLDLVAGTVAGMASLLDPAHILLGGGVPAMAGFPREALARLIREKTRRPLPAEKLRLHFSPRQDPYAGVVGAGLFSGRLILARASRCEANPAHPEAPRDRMK